MKTIVMPELGHIEIAEIDMPVLQDDQALLRLRYGGICGSDLSSYRGINPYVVYPCIPGHEFSAEIVEIKANDRGLKPGMIVTCNPYFNCGNCYSCKRGLVNACTTNKTMGVQRQGAFSEYIAMPIERIFDGKGIDARSLALVEPFCISYHGINRGKVKSGDKVLVVGTGAIGFFAAVSAKLKGAEVTICDVAENKLEYADKVFGFDHKLLNSSDEAFYNGVEELTDGNGFDMTYEAAGVPDSFRMCVNAAAYGGSIIQSGVSKSKVDDFFFTTIQKKELNILGARNALNTDFEEVIRIVSENKLELSRLITKEYAWTEAAVAFSDFHNNSENILKAVLRFE